MKKPDNPSPSIVADDEQFERLAVRSEAVAEERANLRRDTPLNTPFNTPFNTPVNTAFRIP